MDIRKVKKLIELLEESGLAELEISEGEESVRISRYPPGGAVQHYTVAPPPVPVATAPAAGTAPAKAAMPAPAAAALPFRALRPTSSATSTKTDSTDAHGKAVRLGRKD